jgi:hypothetical protein
MLFAALPFEPGGGLVNLLTLEAAYAIVRQVTLL